MDQEACAAAGVEVVRRRSGGGAVLVDPSSLVWVDLVVAATDPLWSADVGRSMWWVGEAWAKALEGAGFGDLSVWKGPMLRSAWSSLVCFAGLGPAKSSAAGGASWSASLNGGRGTVRSSSAPASCAGTQRRCSNCWPYPKTNAKKPPTRGSWSGLGRRGGTGRSCRGRLSCRAPVVSAALFAGRKLLRAAELFASRSGCTVRGFISKSSATPGGCTALTMAAPLVC